MKAKFAEGALRAVELDEERAGRRSGRREGCRPGRRGQYWALEGKWQPGLQQRPGPALCQQPAVKASDRTATAALRRPWRPNGPWPPCSPLHGQGHLSCTGPSPSTLPTRLLGKSHFGFSCTHLPSLRGSESPGFSAPRQATPPWGCCTALLVPQSAPGLLCALLAPALCRGSTCPGCQHGQPCLATCPCPVCRLGLWPNLASLSKPDVRPSGSQHPWPYAVPTQVTSMGAAWTLGSSFLGLWHCHPTPSAPPPGSSMLEAYWPLLPRALAPATPTCNASLGLPYCPLSQEPLALFQVIAPCIPCQVPSLCYHSHWRPRVRPSALRPLPSAPGEGPSGGCSPSRLTTGGNVPKSPKCEESELVTYKMACVTQMVIAGHAHY